MENFSELLTDLNGDSVFIHRAYECGKNDIIEKEKIKKTFPEIAQSFFDLGIILKDKQGGIGTTAYKVFEKDDNLTLVQKASCYEVDLTQNLEEQSKKIFSKSGPRWFKSRRIAVVFKIPKEDKDNYTYEFEGVTYINPKYIVSVIGRTDDLEDNKVQIIDNPYFYENDKIKNI